MFPSKLTEICPYSTSVCCTAFISWSAPHTLWIVAQRLILSFFIYGVPQGSVLDSSLFIIQLCSVLKTTDHPWIFLWIFILRVETIFTDMFHGDRLCQCTINPLPVQTLVIFRTQLTASECDIEPWILMSSPNTSVTSIHITCSSST